MVVPIVGDGSMLLVNQYRYLVGRESMEFPCGSVKEGSTHEETARHELEEETGYSADRCMVDRKGSDRESEKPEVSPGASGTGRSAGHRCGRHRRRQAPKFIDIVFLKCIV
jgi:8-oxo-dGTP pyrophosphatase MutT (NUDIX family)